MSSNKIPFHIAVHEAAHAVALSYFAKKYKFRWWHLESIYIRTPEEVANGPYIDIYGQKRDGNSGMNGFIRTTPLAYLCSKLKIDCFELLEIIDQKFNTNLWSMFDRQNIKATTVCILLNFAGLLAEAKYRNTSFRNLSYPKQNDDIKFIEKEIWLETGDEQSAAKVFSHLENEASMFVDAYWTEICDVAYDLHSEKILTEKRIQKIIKRNSFAQSILSNNIA